MDLEQLVRRAAQRDVKAFVELTRRFQHFAFGSALAMVGDFHRAEDVVQEAFLAAWASLPTLADPAAFPGWLRGFVRHHGSRLLRRRHLEALPLAEAEQMKSDEISPEDRANQRQQAALALAAIGELPATLREPATLFHLYDCSHQDIATFLGLSTTAVNNRLHAARSRLKERMLIMATDTLHAHGLPGDFANRIGRLVEMRGNVVEALFDPQSLPDLLTELAISDEINKRAVTIQVVQRLGGGLVRGITVTPIDSMSRGATVLNSLRHSETPVDKAAFERASTLLAGPPRPAGTKGKLLETGIKAIDVVCPLVAGGTVAIAGELGAGTTVVMEELVRRLSGGADRVSLFTFIQQWPAAREAGFSHADELKKEGFSEGTVGAVQTFFLRAEDGPWTEDRVAGLATADVVIHLSRKMAEARIYPCVDVRTSRSLLLETKAVDQNHADIANRVRQAAALRQDRSLAVSAEPLAFERATKVAKFLGQPFYCAEPWTKRPGTYVSLKDALRGCAEILDGCHDDLPVEAFNFAGGMDEIRARSAKH